VFGLAKYVGVAELFKLVATLELTVLLTKVYSKQLFNCIRIA